MMMMMMVWFEIALLLSNTFPICVTIHSYKLRISCFHIYIYEKPVEATDSIPFHIFVNNINNINSFVGC